MESPGSILKFWFGEETDDAVIVRQKTKLWFGKEEAADAGIRYRFSDSLDMAAAGELEDWLRLPVGRLAFIILTDQFPRHMFRGKDLAYDYDALARKCCREGLKLRAHLTLLPIQRMFFYLPLEHSEQIEDQELSLQLFQEMLDQAPPQHDAMFRSYRDYAQQHYEIIKRFGRFPQRNRVLGRESTPEEIQFLTQKTPSF
jgi:uncharacterized protein (DUF924 family)